MNELNDELKYEMKSTLVSLHYEEVEKEFMEEVKNQITSEDIIKLLIAKIYDIPELKKEVAKRIKTIIEDTDLPEVDFDIENYIEKVLESLKENDEYKKLAEEDKERIEIEAENYLNNDLAYSDEPIEDIEAVKPDYETIIKEDQTTKIEREKTDLYEMFKNDNEKYYTIEEIFEMIPEDFVSNELYSDSEIDPLANENQNKYFFAKFHLLCNELKLKIKPEEINEFLLNKYENSLTINDSKTKK